MEAAPRRYAERTKVPVERSRAELEGLLDAAGATGFGVMRSGSMRQVMFELDSVSVLMEMRVELPQPKARGRARPAAATAASVQSALLAEERRLWRAMVLLVKAKLEAVASGISTVEREFLADVVMRDSRTGAVTTVGKQLSGVGSREDGVRLLLGGGS